jgi:hypothetical protein
MSAVPTTTCQSELGGDGLKAGDLFQLNEWTMVVFTCDNGAAKSEFNRTQNVKLNLASEAGGVRERFTTAKQDARALGPIAIGLRTDCARAPCPTALFLCGFTTPRQRRPRSHPMSGTVSPGKFAVGS